MTKLHRFLLTVLLAFLTGGFITAHAQQEKALRASNLLPNYIEGFEADSPLIVSNRYRDQDFVSVERIFYKTDGSEQIRIIFKDYSINPDDYEKQLKSLKQLNASKESDDITRFKGYILNTVVNDEAIEKVLYLEQNISVEIKHGGAISDSSLSNQLMRKIDIPYLKSTLR